MRAPLFLLALMAAAPSYAQDAMAPLAFAQGCWRGTFVGLDGVSDERCIGPMLGGRYMRDTHVVRGGASAYAGESIYALDAETHQLGYVYFASDGGVLRGVATENDTGLFFPHNRYVGADGSVMELRSTWIRDGADRFAIITEMQEGGAWREFMRVNYVRAPDLSEFTP